MSDELQPRRGPGRPPNPVNETQESPRRHIERNPFGSMQQKLTYPDRSGYHRHWFNDIPGRVSRAQEAGYEHVKDKEGKNICRVVGTAEGGGPLHAYLMEIPQEWYDEDMSHQQQERDEKMAAIKSGQSNRQEGDGRYIPAQGIKIEHGK